MTPAVRSATRRNTFVGEFLGRVFHLGATLPVTTLVTCLNGFLRHQYSFDKHRSEDERSVNHVDSYSLVNTTSFGRELRFD